METYKCPFNGTLIAETFGCANAEPVVRRGGPDVACRSASMHGHCADLFERLKAAALPAFGVEDDLTQMPHSVLMKIQHGGLLGLQRLLGGASSPGVADISALVAQALAQYETASAVPCAQVVPDMTGYQIKRRRG